MNGYDKEAYQKHKDESDLELVVLREQERNIIGSSDYRIAIALLHQREVRRHFRTLVVAWAGVAVAVVGILVAVVGIYSHLWMYQHPVVSTSANSSPASQLGVK
jgi:hypothetical protein